MYMCTYVQIYVCVHLSAIPEISMLHKSALEYAQGKLRLGMLKTANDFALSLNPE